MIGIYVPYSGFYRGAALPTNKPGIPCIFDPHGRAGICGDWLLGSSLESAALSGMTLANHVSATSVFYFIVFQLFVCICVDNYIYHKS